MVILFCLVEFSVDFCQFFGFLMLFILFRHGIEDGGQELADTLCSDWLLDHGSKGGHGQGGTGVILLFVAWALLDLEEFFRD